MKKIFALLLALTVVVCFAGCAKTPPESENEISPPENNGTGESPDGAQVVNPYIEYSSVDKAKAALTFAPFLPPENIEGYKLDEIFIIDGRILQLGYYSEEKNDRVLYRAAAGENLDISGVYSEFPSVNELNIGGRQVLIKGDGENIFLATANIEGNSYCVYFQSGADKNLLTKYLA